MEHRNQQALRIQSVYRGYRTRVVTRGPLWQRSQSTRRIQKIWRGCKTRERFRTLLAAKRRRQEQMIHWEREIFLALEKRVNRLMSVEEVQRPCLEEVEQTAWIELLQLFQHEGRRVRLRQQQIWTRRRFRQQREAAELETMSGIDEELLGQWREAVKRWDTARAEERRATEQREVHVRKARLAEEEAERFAATRSCRQVLRQLRLEESQAKWDLQKKQEEAEREAARARQPEQSEREERLAQWRENRLTHRLAQDEKVASERRRRKGLSAREKCTEFARRYVSRRLNEARSEAVRVAVEDEDDSDAGSTPSPIAKQQRSLVGGLSPKRWTDARATTTRTPKITGGSTGFVGLRNLQHSFRPPSAGAPPQRDSLTWRSKRPATATAGGKSSASLGASAPSRGGGLMPLQASEAFEAEESARWIVSARGSSRAQPAEQQPRSARRTHAVPGSSARGRVQHYLPLLAANDRGLVEVDLNGAGLSDVLVHSLAVALRRNTNCHSLRLDSNGLRDPAAASIAALLQQGNELAAISLRDNKLTDAGVRELAKAVRENPRVRSVDLLGNWEVTNAALEELEHALLQNAHLHTHKISGTVAPAAVLVEG